VGTTNNGGRKKKQKNYPPEQPSQTGKKRRCNALIFSLVNVACFSSGALKKPENCLPAGAFRRRRVPGGELKRPGFHLNSNYVILLIDMELFQESVLLSFLLVTGACIVGILVREILMMRRQLKIEMGTKSRVRRSGNPLKRN
jgi:hypothetical protein